MTKGLPASGKSTWAKQQKAKRINKDDLRAMIDNSVWSKQNEKLILAARDKLVRLYLGEGYDVIVDDTNLDEKHEASLSEIAQEYDAEFVIKDFTDVPLQTCIDRDSARPNSVGKKVIKSMYNRFLHPKGYVAQYVPPRWNPDLPFCIIVDIDGTIAHSTGRNMYDRSRVNEDAVDETVVELVHKYAQHNIMDEMPESYIVIVSGRDSVCRPETEEWLRQHNIPYHELYMRPEGDERKDSIVKQEIYEQYIKERYNVKFILDDRNQVVDMWRSLGLKVLQVAEGDF